MFSQPFFVILKKNIKTKDGWFRVCPETVELKKTLRIDYSSCS